ncbi:hypothetical protein ACFFUB_12780 [Algimonas porphyrae]|uniref:Uncharacterized protein n=2 Tax=Algimonas porphyrae TaxID=1128113 RepID=A0ABQ5UVW2_9PROT|nr:hypothetical protein [Algimonas porphyrae]GLQ19288.1 hypothetical protein GCM10007854_02430 [Algimonas porphyrae]
MKLRTALAISALLSAMIALPAMAAPDVYVVNFRNDGEPASKMLDDALSAAIKIAGVEAEEVIVDTTTAAKWERSAHDAFNRNLVPVFNRWVGLPGFAAIVDADTKAVIGCVTPRIAPTEMARALRQMAQTAQGQAVMTRASTSSATECPADYNTPLVE